MKYHIRMFALILALACLLAGCGAAGQAASSVSAPEASEPAAFGMEISGAPEQLAETTASAGAASMEEPQSAEEHQSGEEPGSAVEEAKDLTRLAVKSAVSAAYLDGLAYDGEDPVYFWRAIGYLVGLAGEEDPAVSAEDDALLIAAEDMAPLVAALFGPYDQQYPSLGEENPLVASEYVDGAEFYRVSPWDFSGIEVTMTEPETAEDGSLTCRAEVTEDGEKKAGYTVTLSEYTAPEGRTPLFAYSVTGLEAETAD